MHISTLPLLTLATNALAGSLLWDGRFNDYTTASDLDKWSWSNPILSYQWYIHGSSPTPSYISLSKRYSNPSDPSTTQGAKLSIDSTSSWNGQSMMRTELIPQTKAPINKGKKHYHFSLKHEAGENAPDASAEHQVAFFESHFTELKFGGASASTLQWFANSQPHASFNFTAGTWYNFAYAIDFDAGSVELWASTAGDELVRKAGPVEVSASSDGQDWHVGVLRLPVQAEGDGAVAVVEKENWFFSGVYVEEGGLTVDVKGPVGVGRG